MKERREEERRERSKRVEIRVERICFVVVCWIN